MKILQLLFRLQAVEMDVIVWIVGYSVSYGGGFHVFIG
jgi:hypothetical protein